MTWQICSAITIKDTTLCDIRLSEKGVEGKYKEEVKYAHTRGSDYNNVLLMANTYSSDDNAKMRYLYLGCSNHMNDNKN